MESSNLYWLQKFYARHCDGDWEHSYGFEIGNIDNPGWRLDFDLTGTFLEDVSFVQIKDYRTEQDWIFCEVQDAKFRGRGGAENLGELLQVLRGWAEENEKE